MPDGFNYANLVTWGLVLLSGAVTWGTVKATLNHHGEKLVAQGKELKDHRDEAKVNAERQAERDERRAERIDRLIAELRTADSSLLATLGGRVGEVEIRVAELMTWRDEVRHHRGPS